MLFYTLNRDHCFLTLKRQDLVASRVTGFITDFIPEKTSNGYVFEENFPFHIILPISGFTYPFRVGR